MSMFGVQIYVFLHKLIINSLKKFFCVKTANSRHKLELEKIKSHKKIRLWQTRIKSSSQRATSKLIVN